jgi:hypothetical protein
MSTSVYSLIDDIQVLLNDVPSVTGAGNSGDRWSFTELLSYLNSSQRDIAVRAVSLGVTPVYSKTRSVRLGVGCKQSINSLYDTDNSTLISDIIRITDITRNMGEVWITGTDYKQGDAVYDPNDGNRYVAQVSHTSSTAPNGDSTNWSTSEIMEGSVMPEQYQKHMLDMLLGNWMNAGDGSTPEEVVFWCPSHQDQETFYVYPQQPNSPRLQFIELSYSAIPSEASGGGNITLKDIYKEAMMDYVLYKAFSKDDDVAENEGSSRASAYLQAYLMNPVFSL